MKAAASIALHKLALMAGLPSAWLMNAATANMAVCPTETGNK